MVDFTRNLFFDEDTDPYMVDPYGMSEDEALDSFRQMTTGRDRWNDAQASPVYSADQTAPFQNEFGRQAAQLQGGGPMSPMTATPPINPAMPAPGHPGQAPQQAPQQGGGLHAFLNSPGAAMANQGINNMMAMRRGRTPTVSPTDAYQQAVQRQAVMAQRDKAQERQERFDERAAEKHDATMNPSWQFEALQEAGHIPAEMSYAEFLQLSKVPKNPSAYAEKASGLAASYGFGSVQEALASGNEQFLTQFRDLTGSGGITINTGDNPAETINELAGFDTTKAQENFRANLQGLPSLLNISNQYQDDYLTTVGQARRRVLGFKDRIGVDLDPDQEADLMAYTQFQNNVEQEFNTYRKLITGAAGSEQELEGLRKSIENMDQGPAAFRASLNNRMESQARQLRGAIYLQALGEAEMGTPAMGELLDKRSQDGFSSAEVANTVGDYIAVSLGYDPDSLTDQQGSAVYKKLKSLGFYEDK